MNRMLASIAVFAAVLVAALLAWRAGEQSRMRRQADASGAAAVRAAEERMRLESESAPRPGEALVERLRVEPATLDFGDLLPDIQVSRSVRLHNIGDRPLRVTRAVADCGCATPSAPDGPIPAGASVEVEVTLRPGVTQGTTLSKRVTWEVDGALPAHCTVRGVVGSFLKCTPSVLDAPADAASAPEGEITLASAIEVPFTVTEVDPSIEVEGALEPAVRQVLHIDWKLWREAGRPLQVMVTTDHPGVPPIPVIIRRHGEP